MAKLAFTVTLWAELPVEGEDVTPLDVLNTIRPILKDAIESKGGELFTVYSPQLETVLRFRNMPPIKGVGPGIEEGA